MRMTNLKFGLLVVLPLNGRQMAFGWMPTLKAGQPRRAVLIGNRAACRAALTRLQLQVQALRP